MRILAPRCLLVACLVLPLLASAQERPPRPTAPSKLPTLPDKDNELYVPYWTLEPGWHTGIELRNNLKIADLVVTPAVRTAAGNEIMLPPVTVKPDEVTMVDLHVELTKAAPHLVDKAGAIGSAVLRYKSPFVHNLYGGSMVHFVGKPIAYHFDATESDRAFDGGTSRESIWWLPNDGAEGHLIVTNASSKPSVSTLTLYAGSGRSIDRPIALGPRQMRRFSVRELVTEAGFAEKSGGLRIQVEKGAESLYSAQVVFNQTTGFSALLRMFERNPEEVFGKVTLRAPMMALSNPDPALMMPEGTRLRPQVFLRNASASGVKVSAVLRWRDGGQNGSVSLGAVELAAGTTGTLEIYKLQDAGKVPNTAPWGTVYLEYEGRYGDLVAIAASYESDGRYGIQTPFNDLMANRWVGSKWFADTLHNSIITVGNGSDKATTANLTLHYNQGKDIYEVEQRLDPGEQIWLDVTKTIRNQVPDKQGRTIPQHVESGSYSVRDMDRQHGATLFEGKLTIDKKFGHASYGCGNCCDCTSPAWDPNPFGAPSGGSWWNNVWGFGQCDATICDLRGAVYGWGSNDGSVATVDAIGYGTGNNPGSTSLFGFIAIPSYSYKCPYRERQISAPGTVFNVSVTAADIAQDKITVIISGPPTMNGTLSLEAVHPNGASIYIGTYNRIPGTHIESFNIPNLPYGEYSSIRARYTYNGFQVQHTRNYHIKVLGIYRQTQYNSPAESSCSGDPTPVAFWNPNPSCQSFTDNVRSGFNFRVTDPNTGTGSGHSINHADVLMEAFCSTGSGNLRPNSTITGTKGPVNDATVAVCRLDPDLYVTGRKLYIHGYGVKTVTDSCPACCADIYHLDNYTTNTACSGIPSLTSSKTIIIY